MKRPLILLALGTLFIVGTWKGLRYWVQWQPSSVDPYAPPQRVPSVPWAIYPVTEPALGETLMHDTAVTYYDIRGNTSSDLNAVMNVIDATQKYEGESHIQFVYHPGDLKDGVCGTSASEVRVDSPTVVLPRWLYTKDATDDAKQWWFLLMKKLTAHEQGHIDLALANARAATLEMHQTNCSNAQAVLNSIIVRENNAQSQYDVDNYSTGSEQKLLSSAGTP